jgi:hypothetical protein
MFRFELTQPELAERKDILHHTANKTLIGLPLNAQVDQKTNPARTPDKSRVILHRGILAGRPAGLCQPAGRFDDARVYRYGI